MHASKNKNEPVVDPGSVVEIIGEVGLGVPVAAAAAAAAEAESANKGGDNFSILTTVQETTEVTYFRSRWYCNC